MPFRKGYIPFVEWTVHYTDQFEGWWNELSEDEQEAINTKVILLQRVGPALGRPHADTIRQSRHSNMKELIIQHAGKPFRVFFAFDPKREAILLIGGNKTGDHDFYRRFIPMADDLFDQHLKALEREDNKND